MLLHIEGFDGGGTTKDSMILYVTKRYPTATASGNLSNGAGRYDGGRSWGIGWGGRVPFCVNNKQTVIIGFAIKIAAWGDDKFILTLLDDNTLQIGLKTITGGELRLVRGATTLGTTSGLNCAINTWYYIELEVKIHDSTGSYELRVDTATVLNASSVNTQETSNAYTDEVRIYADYSTWHYYDDIYILDNTGSQNNTFLGNMKIIMISPNAVGDSTQFVPLSENNFENVDDGVIPDWDSTYVKSEVVGHKDLYNFTDQSNIAGIAGIEIIVDAKKTDAATKKLKLGAKVDTTENFDSGQPISADYGMISRIMEYNPKNISWEIASLNNTQFGFELV